MDDITLDQLTATTELVRRLVPATPQYAWPLLARRSGCEVWVKHENHTPTGAFKARNVIGYLSALRDAGMPIAGTIAATRGNHGQAVALTSARLGLPSVIVVPQGNATEKNLAMEAFGAELVVAGADFDQARLHAETIARERGLHVVPAFHPLIVRGAASYALELFQAVADLDAVYVGIGMGSGICGLIAARDRLNLKTEIVGVVAERAPAMALSLAAGAVVTTPTAATFADGLACRQPHPEALAVIRRGAARIVRVSEDEIAQAMRAYFADTHSAAEGAGAAPLAALLQERAAMAGRRVGLILSGGNVDTRVFAQVLAGRTPGV